MADPKKDAIVRRANSLAGKPVTGGPQAPNLTRPVMDTKVKDFARKGSNSSNYYAWRTSSGKKPDFGKGQTGPGTPYREVLTNYKVKQESDKPTGKPSVPSGDFMDQAIRRRLTETPQKKDPIAIGWRAAEARRLAKKGSYKPSKIPKDFRPGRDVPKPNPNF